MFDKLIESNSEEADFKPRRTFFMVSFVVVGIAFLSALVFDLYAANFDLGTDNFEVAELLAPVANEAPEPPRPQPQQTNTQRAQTELPNRPVLIAQMDQSQRAPETISTTPNKYASIPDGRFTNDLGKAESDASGIGSTRGTNVGDSSSDEATTVAETVKLPDPPPVAPKAEAPKRPVSIGVANGKATYLPKPPYPATAIAVRAEGEVSVQVTIDEQGKVISAKAISGHPLLKGVSEKAAWNAKFTPTTLSKVPVKVTGVIVYNFKKS